MSDNVVSKASTSTTGTELNEKGANTPRKPSAALSYGSSGPSAASITHQSQSNDSPTSRDSPRFRELRKRATSVTSKDDDEETGAPDDSPAHTRAGSGDSASTTNTAATHVCLCQPDPKIPRPRNAFILYRQHHQGSVVARNLGVPNPEISKILGEQWRKEPASVKNEWKMLAEEEKIRHQQQYPEYRYQPRRHGRRTSVDPNAGKTTTVDKYRCSKCGGRSIISAAAPLSLALQSPSSYSQQGSESTLLPLPTPTTSASASSSSRFLPMLNNLSLASPQLRRPHPQDNPPRHSSAGGLHIDTSRDGSIARRYDICGTSPPLSSEFKRRRFNNSSQTPEYISIGRANSTSMGSPASRTNFTAPPNTPHPAAATQLARTSSSWSGPPGQSSPRRSELPERWSRGNSSGSSMPPPPTPRHSVSGPRDAGLTLPPLQSAIALSGASESDRRHGVEIMIMSTQRLPKIKLLGRIAPPFATGGPLGPSTKSQTRGSIVAIEADDMTAAYTLTSWLEDWLNRSGEFTAKVAEGPEVPGQEKDVTLADYLDVVRDWHNRSKIMVDFIFPKPSEESHGEPQKQRETRRCERRADSRMDVDSGKESEKTSEDSEHKKRKGSASIDPPASTPLPVVLIPSYQLHASDAFASRIPITDEYSPADHWQWIATLWRGVVGPDVTIYIKDANSEELARERAVEVKEDCRCLVIRKEKVTDKFDDKTLRRVGFELGEWVRSVGMGAKDG
ncbi:hypothetical protein BDY21DRAFT_383962 [Lineolata rhizophorae]|uniref:HMG box domain-containing protein n=1 Tax=Lineolata rhizophorae TaxID=578093 RepID=A0A6A6P904_9PEZI|nr:hypothetical protein BDY21DRAFT_383962 [Lineolata rhizophorae]